MIFLDCLMLQPTYECGLRCEECYIHSHARYQEKQTPVFQQLKLLEEFAKGERHTAYQIVVSFNDFSEFGSYKSTKHLIGIAEGVTALAKEYTMPMWCIIMHSPDTLQQYIRNIGSSFEKELYTSVYAIDFSVIKQRHHAYIKYLRECEEAMICYNPLVYTSEDLDCALAIKDKVDWVNINFAKGMGKLPIFAKGDYRLMSLDNDGSISIDRCLDDIIRYEIDGTTCGANISFMHVWPDGSVTGCPCKKKSNTMTAMTAENIIKNIEYLSRSTQATYVNDDFKLCPMRS